jgi:uncharacterized protein involved in exopolysaccharide biosynthesis
MSLEKIAPVDAMTPNNNLPPEDLDLLLLLERSLRFFSRFKLLLLTSLLCGLLLGFMVYLRLPTVYQSRLILHSFTLSNEDLIQVSDNFDRLLKKGGIVSLAEQMEIPTESLEKVKQIKANQIQKVFTPNNPNGFYIDVYVTDNSVLPTLQKGIINGFENIDFIKRQLAIKKENFQWMIADVEKEIAKLDSTKTEVERSLKGGRSTGSLLMVDITGLNKQLIEMNEKLLNYRQEIQFLAAVQVLQPFSAFNKPAGPNFFVWLGIGLIGGLAIGYAIAILKSTQARIRQRRQQSMENK